MDLLQFLFPASLLSSDFDFLNFLFERLITLLDGFLLVSIHNGLLFRSFLFLQTLICWFYVTYAFRTLFAVTFDHRTCFIL